MTLRYIISKEGYSNTKTVELASNVSEESVAIFNERNDEFPVLTISIIPIRNYILGSVGSHILGYVSRINENELKQNKGYLLNDRIGKTGIEYIFEPYLKGKNGIKQIDMAVDGSITGEAVVEEAISGNDVVLTIDGNLQKITEDALKTSVEKIRYGGYG